ncbi:MAG: hypothetical protein QOH55_389 [Microbacteriaceae bacterium]|nr:hypothetical protein [Microbacteriaceae bacterium]
MDERNGEVVTTVLGGGETAQPHEFCETLNLSLEFDPIEKTLDGAVLLSTVPDTDVPCVKHRCRWWDSNPHALSDKAF